MELIDAIVRFAGVGLLLNLAVLAAVHKARLLLRFVLIALCLSVGAVLINSSNFDVSPPLRFALILFEAPNTALVWWAGLLLFQDDFKLGLVHWAILGLVFLWGFQFVCMRLKL